MAKNKNIKKHSLLEKFQKFKISNPKNIKGCIIYADGNTGCTYDGLWNYFTDNETDCIDYCD